MKASTQTTVLLKALDLELKAMLQKDLTQFKSRQQNQVAQEVAKKQAA
ncbi:hypothetical protein HH214_11005 [Mucilaginibacter robiniae]|uniref:Uncharacterized protein n=1 Tax=Mucilaginibacter robiniae TaxID=2728022 RepID=A0A7L5E7K8_9SPHI|nr:hypothetical protein [Mucilaginibacter robiniae]QJD96356.1 hypothetical protein HH214_11005 [Mucilaginibacter robiniae]